MVIKGKVELLQAIAAHSLVVEAREAFGSDDEWPQVLKEIRRELLGAPVLPAWGSDWSAFLDAHLEEAIEEAISIVM